MAKQSLFPEHFYRYACRQKHIYSLESHIFVGFFLLQSEIVLFFGNFYLLLDIIKSIPIRTYFLSSSGLKILNLSAISSGSGRMFRRSSGTDLLSLYVATPIGASILLRAYSTTVLSLLLQIIIPMEGFSSGSFTCSSRAVSYICILPAYSASKSPIFNSIATRQRSLLWNSSRSSQKSR